MKVTTTIWTCDRCGREEKTEIAQSPPTPGGAPPMMSMTPPMPVDWREYTPQFSPVLLCGECNKDFAAWVLVMPPARK